MKHLIALILVLLLNVAPARAVFGNEERQRRIETERQLSQQREATGGWQIIAGLFAIGSITLLVIGTAIGSRTRHNGTRK
jgi:hypothetical protein